MIYYRPPFGSGVGISYHVLFVAHKFALLVDTYGMVQIIGGLFPRGARMRVAIRNWSKPCTVRFSSLLRPMFLRWPCLFQLGSRRFPPLEGEGVHLGCGHESLPTATEKGLLDGRVLGSPPHPSGIFVLFVPGCGFLHRPRGEGVAPRDV